MKATRAVPTAFAACLLAAGALFPAFAASPGTPVTVRTDAGLLAGAEADGATSFKGIRYARPPLGPLRWRVPQPVEPWTGTRDALDFGPICMQQWPNPDNGVGAEQPSEDCLTLNVWTPHVEPEAGLPVMVWIHGGGFVNGSGSPPLYDGSYLARQGVVVVTLNYRLGRLGFFAHPALVREAGDAEPVGNYGLQDMIAALEWVQRNVAAFGGDPGNVTVFGESAGGMAVNRLMIAPAAKGLFHRAAVQSGAGGELARRLRDSNVAGMPSAQDAGLAFARALGIDGENAAALAALRDLPAEQIIANEESPFDGGGPIVDGTLITMDAVPAFAAGMEARVPYLTGYNSTEMPLQPDRLDAMLARITAGRDASPLRALYPDAATLGAHVMGDVVFATPARQLAALHAANGAPTYLYRFDVVSSSMRDKLPGAPHAQERQYVFGTLAASPWPSDADDIEHARTISAYWVAFAGTGDPNGDGRPRWPAYAAGADRLLEFNDGGPAAEPVPFAKRLDAIGTLRGD